jgi:translation initiation factor IF-2
MGWDDVPAAGDFFEVVEERQGGPGIADERRGHQAVEAGMSPARDRLQGLLEQLRSEDAQLNLIVKADAQGSLEALRESIGKIEREGGKIQIVHTVRSGGSTRTTSPWPTSPSR